MLLTRDDLGGSFSELGLISASFSLCYIGCICLLPLYFEAGVISWGRLTAGFFGTYFLSMVFFHDSWSDVVNITFIVYWDLIFAFLNSHFQDSTGNIQKYSMHDFKGYALACHVPELRRFFHGTQPLE